MRPIVRRGFLRSPIGGFGLQCGTRRESCKLVVCTRKNTENIDILSLSGFSHLIRFRLSLAHSSVQRADSRPGIAPYAERIKRGLLDGAHACVRFPSWIAREAHMHEPPRCKFQQIPTRFSETERRKKKGFRV
jgi:hypothetical protein